MQNTVTAECRTPESLPDWDFLEESRGFTERRQMEEVRILTHATPLDCIYDERFDRIIFIIKKGDMGFAIGKNGDNIRRLSEIFGRHIEMVEFDESREAFAANMFKPAEVAGVSFSGEKVTVTVREKENVGLAIGRNGTTIEKAKLILKRFFGCDAVDVTAMNG